ncbi:CUT domain-containing protein [Ditylenchus destructor]|nr:CUT domain-containing protein [Ditylenchus destructor]
MTTEEDSAICHTPSSSSTTSPKSNYSSSTNSQKMAPNSVDKNEVEQNSQLNGRHSPNENQDIELELRHKDHQITSLEAENRRLKAHLSEKEGEYQARLGELIQELERHAELVDNLQTKLTVYERKEKIAQPQKKHPNQYTNRLPGAHVGKTSNVPHKQSRYTINQTANVRNPTASQSVDQFIHSKVPTNPDEICAALSSFVEKNKAMSNANNVLNGTPMDENINTISFGQRDGEIDSDALECLNKLIAENPAAVFLNGGNGHNGYQYDQTGLTEAAVDPAQLIAMLFDNSSSPTPTSPKHPNSSAAIVSSIERVLEKVESQHLSNQKHSKLSDREREKAIDDSISSTISSVAASGGKPLSVSNTGKAYSSPLSSMSMQTPQNVPKPQSEEETRIINLMQQRMSQNVARIGDHALNTIEIAKQCKRLMVAYNIGQRLFAKAVMCQVVKSQGSLSELLSKPRAWHKLTDKGREAFRRIFGWLSDDTAIELLCSLSPRRVAMPCDKIEHPTAESLLESYGPDSSPLPPMPPAEFPEDLDSDKVLDPMMDSMLPMPPTNIIVTKTIASPSPTPPISQSIGVRNNASSNTVTMVSGPRSIAGGGNSRWRHDDIPKEKIIGIFEAEKAKLREQESNLERAVRSASPSSSRGSVVSGGFRRYPKHADQPMETRSSQNQVHSFSDSDYGNCSGAMGQRSRAEPAPIVQDQFERYPVLDTEEVVKQVKEYLSRHSVSQRQFGENVLGLSQGSVSDLLARPKAWSQLTHKGREPFIRMKIFLDEMSDQQQKQQINGNASINGNAFEQNEDGGLDQNTATSEEFILSILDKIKSEPEPESEVCFIEEVARNSESGPVATSTPRCAQVSDETANGHDLACSEFANEVAEADPTDFGEELDTTDIARRVKDFLSKNGVSQRAFGEHVMGMTSGSVSDLLSRPKPWVMLSWKGRESYTKMHSFLSDEKSMQALINGNHPSRTSISAQFAQKNPTEITVKELLTGTNRNGYANLLANGSAISLVTSRPAINTSRLNHANNCVTNDSVPSANGIKRKLDEPVTRASALAQSNTMVQPPIQQNLPPAKKIPRFQRTIITDKQKEALLYIFAHEQRPSTKTIDQLSIKLGLSSRTVTNWFHNYRTRQKIQLVDNGMILPSGQTITIDNSNESWFKDLADILKKNNTSSSLNGTTSSSSTPANEEDNYIGADDLSLIGVNNTSSSAGGGESDGLGSPNSERYAIIDGNKLSLALDDDVEDQVFEDHAYAAKEEASHTPVNKSSGQRAKTSKKVDTVVRESGPASSSQLDRAIARMHNRLTSTSVARS